MLPLGNKYKQSRKIKHSEFRRIFIFMDCVVSLPSPYCTHGRTPEFTKYWTLTRTFILTFFFSVLLLRIPSNTGILLEDPLTSWAQWLTPVIPAMWEAESRRMVV
jgi:hypothetical protein